MRISGIARTFDATKVNQLLNVYYFFLWFYNLLLNSYSGKTYIKNGISVTKRPNTCIF